MATVEQSRRKPRKKYVNLLDLFTIDEGTRVFTYNNEGVGFNSGSPVLDRSRLSNIHSIHDSHFSDVDEWDELRNGQSPIEYPSIDPTRDEETLGVTEREAEIVNMANEYLGQTEVVFLGNLPTFLMVPKYPETFSTENCIDLIQYLRQEGCIVFWTADTMVLLPPPPKAGQELKDHKRHVELILSMASYNFHIGGGAFRDFCGIEEINPDEANTFITITRDVKEYVLNGAPETFFDNGGLGLIAARRMLTLKLSQFSILYNYSKENGLLDKEGRVPSYLDFPEVTDAFLDQHNAGVAIAVEPIIEEIAKKRLAAGLSMTADEPASEYKIQIAALASKAIPDGTRWFKSKQSLYGELNQEQQEMLFAGISYQDFVEILESKKFNYPITRETFTRHLVSKFFKLEIDTSNSTSRRQVQSALESALALSASISLHRTIRYRITQRIRQIYKMYGLENDEYVMEHLTTGESSTMLIPDELLEDEELRALFIRELEEDIKVVNKVYSKVSNSEFHVSLLQLPPGTIIGIYRKFIQSFQFAFEAYEAWFAKIEAAAAELSKMRGGVITQEIIGRIIDTTPPPVNARAFGATEASN